MRTNAALGSCFTKPTGDGVPVSCAGRSTATDRRYRLGTESLPANELLCGVIHTPLLSAACRSCRLHAEWAPSPLFRTTFQCRFCSSSLCCRHTGLAFTSQTSRPERRCYRQWPGGLRASGTHSNTSLTFPQPAAVASSSPCRSMYAVHAVASPSGRDAGNSFLAKKNGSSKSSWQPLRRNDPSQWPRPQMTGVVCRSDGSTTACSEGRYRRLRPRRCWLGWCPRRRADWP